MLVEPELRRKLKSYGYQIDPPEKEEYPPKWLVAFGLVAFCLLCWFIGAVLSLSFRDWLTDLVANVTHWFPRNS